MPPPPWASFFHELATNALKYGAFADRDGQLAVSWGFEAVDGARHLVLRWREHQGPPVTRPQHKGFGTELIERSLHFEFGGNADLDFAADGLSATLSIPAEDVIAKGESHGR